MLEDDKKFDFEPGLFLVKLTAIHDYWRKSKSKIVGQDDKKDEKKEEEKKEEEKKDDEEKQEATKEKQKKDKKGPKTEKEIL